MWAQAQISVIDSVGLDLEPLGPGPDISNGQCGPRPRPLGPGLEPLGPGPEPLGPGPEPLGSGPEPLGPGPDVFNRPLNINNGKCGTRPTHQ